MGKRKSRSSSELAAAAARKRARTTLPSRFECPFCNMHNTVVATLKPDEGRATVACDQCGMRYNTTCRTLTEPVDVYHEWLDACEEAVHTHSPPQLATPAATSLQQRRALQSPDVPHPQAQGAYGAYGGAEEGDEGDGGEVAEEEGSVEYGGVRKKQQPPRWVKPPQPPPLRRLRPVGDLPGTPGASPSNGVGMVSEGDGGRRQLAERLGRGMKAGGLQSVSGEAVEAVTGSRRSSDGGSGGSSGVVVVSGSAQTQRRQTEVIRQQAAVRAFGAYDDYEDD